MISDESESKCLEQTSKESGDRWQEIGEEISGTSILILIEDR